MEENQVLDEELQRSFRFQNRELLDNYIILAVTNSEGIIKHVTTNLCNEFKYKPDELLNKPYTFLIKKDSILSFENQFKDVKELNIVWKGEIKHADKSDNTIWTDTIITPLFNDENKHVGFILASSDITKEKKLKKINEENILNKKHDSSVLDFMPSLSSAVLLKTSSSLHKILWIISFTIIFLTSWAYFSEIDDIVKTEGKIITTTNVQTISSLDGGILKESFVKEGDRVKKGDVLFRLSDINFKTEYEKNIYNKYALLAKQERLEAQAQNRKIISNKEVLEFDRLIMDHEIDLFNTNTKKLNASINVLKEQLNQKKSELSNTYKNKKITQRNYELVEKEMKIKVPLVKERILSKVELLELKRKKNDIEADLKNINNTIATVKSSIKEINKSIEETKETYISQSKDELVIVYNDLNQIKEDLIYLDEKIKETTVTSPNDGVVNKVTVKTKGEAISPGKVIAEIIPDTSYVLAQVKVSPADIGFLYVGQKVKLKLRPYDFSLYGTLDSEISYISADTLIDEKDQKQEIYIVHIKSPRKFIDDAKKLEIKPGMTVDADIITGKKKIISYILKPIIRSLEI